MMKAVLMPQFGATMLTGTIIRWLKQEGEEVKKGETLLEVMTDKVAMEVESFETGTLKKILAHEGEEIQVSQVIAYIGDQNDALPESVPAEKIGAAEPAPATAAARQPVQPAVNARQGRLLVSPVARKLAEENGIDLYAVQGTEPGGRIGKADVLRAIEEKKKQPPTPEISTPIAEPKTQGTGETQVAVEFSLPKMADNMASGIVVSWLANNGARIEKGQPLLEIETDRSTTELESPASGTLTIRPGIEPGVEVRVGETLAYIAARGAAVPARKPFFGVRAQAPEVGDAPASAYPFLEREDVEWLDLTPIQRVTGQRMVQSVQTAPQFALSLSVDMTRALEFRQVHLPRVEAATGERLSMTTILVKVVALVLRQFPRANASFEDKRIKLHQRVNIGVAIGTSDGLVVPVIKDADRKSLLRITRELKAYQEKASRMQFSLEDLSGGTFTISNLGMYGIERFHALINPPESAILAVGRIAKIPVGMPDESIALRPLMSLTLSIDHRALDGLQGAQVLSRIKELLEQPYLFVD